MEIFVKILTSNFSHGLKNSNLKLLLVFFQVDKDREKNLDVGLHVSMERATLLSSECNGSRRYTDLFQIVRG